MAWAHRKADRSVPSVKRDRAASETPRSTPAWLCAHGSRRARSDLALSSDHTRPANWIPLIGVQPVANDPSIQFEKAAMLHPDRRRASGRPALGKFLRPTDIPPATPFGSWPRRCRATA